MTCIRRAFRTEGIRTWGRKRAVKTNRLVLVYMFVCVCVRVRVCVYGQL